jgi:release factor glutamine methyltransferase
MSTTASKTWTTRALLAWMGEAFTKQGLDSPRLLAELLLAHVLGTDRLKLYLDPDRPASPLERDTLRTLVGRALRHEPVQYLVGEAWFFGLPFRSDKRALIPRPCTQTIVEHVLQHYRATHGPSQAVATPPSESAPMTARAAGAARGDGLLIADVCTGSGAIAIALLKNLPAARAVATDISQDALSLAKENALKHDVTDRLDLLQGDLLAPLRAFPPTAEGTLHYLVSNPPYIPDSEWPSPGNPGQVDQNVLQHEPHLALRGGPDGMKFVGPLIEHGPALLRTGGQLLVEIAAASANPALTHAQRNPLLRDAKILKDQDNLDRVLLATRV